MFSRGQLLPNAIAASAVAGIIVAGIAFLRSSPVEVRLEPTANLPPHGSVPVVVEKSVWPDEYRIVERAIGTYRKASSTLARLGEPTSIRGKGSGQFTGKKYPYLVYEWDREVRRRDGRPIGKHKIEAWVDKKTDRVAVVNVLVLVFDEAIVRLAPSVREVRESMKFTGDPPAIYTGTSFRNGLSVYSMDLRSDDTYVLLGHYPLKQLIVRKSKTDFRTGEQRSSLHLSPGFSWQNVALTSIYMGPLNKPDPSFPDQTVPCMRGLRRIE